MTWMVIPPTYPMDIALDTGWEVIVDHFPHSLEVHTTSHNLGADKNPGFAFTHAGDGIFTLLSRHTSV
jgi:hypothetical protein